MSINRTKIKRQLYAKGGLGQLVGREKFGIGSKFKSAFKKVTQPVVKVAQKLVPKEIAGPLMMAAPFLGPVYGPIAYAAGSAKKTGRIDPIKLALVSAPYVKFQGGQGIGAFKPVGYGGSKYGIFGGDEVMYEFPSLTKTTPEAFVPSGEVGIGDYVDTGLTPESYAKAQTVTDPGVIVPQPSTPTSGPVSIADVAGKYFKEPLSILKTKESPAGRSIQEVLVGAATSPQSIVSTGVGVTQYITAKKKEIEDAGGTFDREAYDNALNDYYTKYASSFQRGFSKKGGLSQLSPRTKFKGGLSASRVTQLLQLKEEAIQQGNDDKVIEIDQELYALTGKVFESNGGIIKLRKKLEDGFKATDLLDSEYFDQKADDKERVINDLLDQGYDYEEVMKLVSPESIYRDDQGMPQTFGEDQPMITFDIETIGKKNGGRIGYRDAGFVLKGQRRDPYEIVAGMDNELNPGIMGAIPFFTPGKYPIDVDQGASLIKEIQDYKYGESYPNETIGVMNKGVFNVIPKPDRPPMSMEQTISAMEDEWDMAIEEGYEPGRGGKFDDLGIYSKEDIRRRIELGFDQAKGPEVQKRNVRAAKGGRIGYMGGGNIKSVPIRNNGFGVKELDYRAGGGFVPVGVKERADDVPAMLSKNEFVMTANAVRGAGNGDINKGARKMYNLMKNLETRRV